MNETTFLSIWLVCSISISIITLDDSRGVKWPKNLYVSLPAQLFGWYCHNFLKNAQKLTTILQIKGFKEVIVTHLNVRSCYPSRFLGKCLKNVLFAKNGICGSGVTLLWKLMYNWIQEFCKSMPFAQKQQKKFEVNCFKIVILEGSRSPYSVTFWPFKMSFNRKVILLCTNKISWLLSM